MEKENSIVHGTKECAYPHCAYGAYHGAVKDSVDDIKDDLREFKEEIKAMTSTINDGFKQFGLIMGIVEFLQKEVTRHEKAFDKAFKDIETVRSNIDGVKKTRTDWLWDVIKLLAVAGIGFAAAKLGGA